jgi:hypothetical protein
MHVINNILFGESEETTWQTYTRMVNNNNNNEADPKEYNVVWTGFFWLR